MVARCNPTINKNNLNRLAGYMKRKIISEDNYIANTNSLNIQLHKFPTSRKADNYADDNDSNKLYIV